jgi:hypothetical protein
MSKNFLFFETAVFDATGGAGAGVLKYLISSDSLLLSRLSEILVVV